MHYLLALVGHPVKHSLSPPMHRAALKHYGLQGNYSLIDVAPGQIKPALEQLKFKRFTGFNVTAPYKLEIIKLLDELTDQAHIVQAVNTVTVTRAGKLIGHNTDVGGFVTALGQVCPAGLSKGQALVVGAGGAARAAIAGLAHLGWRSICVVARKEQSLAAIVDSKLAERIENLHELPVFVAGSHKGSLPSVQLLVNCTPIGLTDETYPFWMEGLFDRLSRQGLFFDMVYRKACAQTPLVALARSRGFTAYDGLSMLVNQAALSFNYWTGRPGPVEVMQNALIGTESKAYSTPKLL